MSYLSKPSHGARVPVGWWDSAITLCSTFGDIASSSASASSSNVQQLQRQINRYTADGGAPVQLRIGAAPLPITGVVDVDTATRALWILQMRAGMAQLAWDDASSKELVAEAMKAWGAPVTFVTKNLGRITQIIKLFADKSNVPPPKGTLAGMTPTVIVGALTIGALLYMRGGRKR